MDKRGQVIGAIMCVVGIIGCCILLPFAYNGTRQMFSELRQEYEKISQRYQIDTKEVPALKLIGDFDVELRQSSDSKLLVYRSNAKASSNDNSISNTKDTVVIAKNNVQDIRIKVQDIFMRLLTGDTAERVIIYIPTSISIDTEGFSGELFNLNNVAYANMNEANLDSLATDNLAIYAKEVSKKIDEINYKIVDNKENYVDGAITQTEYNQQSSTLYNQLLDCVDKYLTRAIEQGSQDLNETVKQEILDAFTDYFNIRRQYEAVMLEQEKTIKAYRNQEIDASTYQEQKNDLEDQEQEIQFEMTRKTDRVQSLQEIYLADFTNLIS